MKGLLAYFRISLRLYFRNRLALLYGYLFPLVFLAIFWVLYRHEDVPLRRHLGELLTVAVLGGACFGLPTTLVGERELGVWRRYRLTPVRTWSMVASTALARYGIILSAGLLQLGVALAVGMTAPDHPFALWTAFTAAAFAFIGLGLVIAALADNVPAVQALGQCIFLPMLVIGGVAVSLASLPVWAQHVSAFFPGRYAVEAMQAAVTGRGLPGMRFSLGALALTGVAGIMAGTRLFRWDVQQTFMRRAGKAWLALVVAAWVAAGLLAEARGRIAVAADSEPRVAAPAEITAGTETSSPTAWENITSQQVAGLNFNVPSDDGVVAPMAHPDERPDEGTAQQLENLSQRLPNWAAGNSGPEIQRVRNLLCVAAVTDVAQQPAERFVPPIILERLADAYPKAKLIKILAWIVLHPDEGTVINDIAILGIPCEVGDPEMIRERVSIYAIKFIARLTGRTVE